ncbi:MAG: T9SS type A sorting domain-containing protein, partial [Flavobacteriales bacterium]
VLVYPNPSSNIIYISGIEYINNVKIYSSIGKLMLESQEKTIDISKINSGHYTVVVETENDLVRTVLIKQ